eukprot:TRINITY_DN9909_c0_g1_i2.p1 TRINITY_DN9909_c0_g1~~TRINITY_DN9909_c0_g1_i2.p1  ORF type:complete len:304 (+),score=63.07 TRINITY_DN9909_c0_g1_i2:47-958(+)
MSGSESSRSRAGSTASTVDRMVSGRAKALSFSAENMMGGGLIKMCGCMWTKNARTFLLSLVLFSTITMAQTVGALLANSMALLADCASMALDAVTYAVNLFAECKEETNLQLARRNQLISSGLSFLALTGITSFFFYQGLHAVIVKDWEGSDGGDDVNAWIVLAFATAGILFDLISLTPYILYGCPCLKKKSDEEGENVEMAEQMNLCSALMHVAADLLRSTTTMVESILILQYGINGEEADSYATVIVSGTILLGAVKPVCDWFGDLRDYRDEYGSQDVELIESNSNKLPLVANEVETDAIN